MSYHVVLLNNLFLYVSSFMAVVVVLNFVHIYIFDWIVQLILQI